jgi:hypothetical protein
LINLEIVAKHYRYTHVMRKNNRTICNLNPRTMKDQKKKPQSDAGKNAQKVNKDQRAPQPGSASNAAGKDGKGKVVDPRLGARPGSDKEAGRTK